MIEDTEKFTENEKPASADTVSTEPEDMQANLNSLQDALASLTAVVGTIKEAGAEIDKKKDD